MREYRCQILVGNALTSPLTLGVTLGLLIGKPLGVFLFSYIAVKLKIAKLSEGINFKQIFAIAVLCGIGFDYVNVSFSWISFLKDQSNSELTAFARLDFNWVRLICDCWLYFIANFHSSKRKTNYKHQIRVR